MQTYICNIEYNSRAETITASSPAEAVNRFCEQVNPPDEAMIVCRNQATGETVTYGVRQVITYIVSEV